MPTGVVRGRGPNIFRGAGPLAPPPPGSSPSLPAYLYRKTSRQVPILSGHVTGAQIWLVERYPPKDMTKYGYKNGRENVN